MRIAIGVFDGAHRGHQKVIEKAHLVLAIDPHPNPEILLLTSPNEKKELIGKMDFFKFTPDNAQMTPEEFVQWLIKKYAPEKIIIGHDFHFGKQRTGNVSALRKLGKKYNFQVEEIKEFCLNKKPVRSSVIRKHLQSGQIKQANNLLGRNYQLNGKVIKGKRLGRKLGAPTINLKIDHPRKLIPAEGVYRAEVIVKNKLYPAGVFIGQNSIEAHLLNFQGNLYGANAKILLADYLRPNQNFSDLKKLAAQIKKDIQKIKRLAR